MMTEFDEVSDVRPPVPEVGMASRFAEITGEVARYYTTEHQDYRQDFCQIIWLRYGGRYADNQPVGPERSHT
jgi:hypothetical protein